MDGFEPEFPRALLVAQESSRQLKFIVFFFFFPLDDVNLSCLFSFSLIPHALYFRAYGVVSMCIGTGMGAAAVFEYPGN